MTIKDLSKEFVAGTIGGWAQVVTGHPFDTLKVRLQTQAGYKSGLDCFIQTVRQEGAWALYKGVTSPLAGIGVCNAVLFSANGHFRRLIGATPSDKGRVLMAGCMSGAVMALINCPVELLKVKLQIQTSVSTPASTPVSTPISTYTAAAAGRRGGGEQYKGVVDAGKRIYSQYGLVGLYRGIGATLMRDIPAFGVYFGSYEYLKQNTGMGLVMAGGCAGILAWMSSYPQDMLKSRMQSNNSFKSTGHCWSLMYKENGFNLRAYFRGFGPTLMRAFPANAATFFAYEKTLSLFPS